MYKLYIPKFRDRSRIFQRGLTFVKGGGGGSGYPLSDHHNTYESWGACFLYFSYTCNVLHVHVAQNGGLLVTRSATKICELGACFIYFSFVLHAAQNGGSLVTRSTTPLNLLLIMQFSMLSPGEG